MPTCNGFDGVNMTTVNVTALMAEYQAAQVQPYGGAPPNAGVPMTGANTGVPQGNKTRVGRISLISK